MLIEAIGVVVPARNEHLTVAECIASVIASFPAGLACFVVVVDDGSSDGTAELAASALGSGTGAVVRTCGRNVGAARSRGVERALDELRTHQLGRTWLAFTDADSFVPGNWLERQLVHANSGIDAVAGLVRPRGLSPALQSAFDAKYARRIHGRFHRHVHGANLGVRASAYSAAGGFPPVQCHEDRLLWERLLAKGHPTVSDADLWVSTSARTQGRLRGGFAADLAALAKSELDSEKLQPF